MQMQSSKQSEATIAKRNSKQQVKKNVQVASKQKCKLPLNARGAALAVLLEVLEEGAYTNLAINKYLRTHELERGLLIDLLGGTLFICRFSLLA